LVGKGKKLGKKPTSHPIRAQGRKSIKAKKMKF